MLKPFGQAIGLLVVFAFADASAQWVVVHAHDVAIAQRNCLAPRSTF